MLRAQQYAVLLPGGVEPLIHARRCFRKAVVDNPALGVWCEVDVDLVNAYPSMEWPAVDAAVREEIPQLARWSEWCHKEEPILLPGGGVHLANREAEQGDPEASAQCGAVIAGARRRARQARTEEAGPGPTHAFDVWFADDGQAFVRPEKVDGYLRALDQEIQKAGCTRGEMPDAKSAVTPVGHPDALAALGDGWLTPYVRRTCQVREPNATVEVLGTVVCDDDAVRSQFDACVGRTAQLHQAIEQLGDPATELTLGRSCADIARVSHLLRTAGDIIAGGAVGEHDLQQQRFIERVLGSELGQAALAQAALGLHAGGLGFRNAADTVLAAFVSSRVEAAPLVGHIFAGMAEEGLPVETAQAVYDGQLAAAREELVATLGPERGQRLGRLLDEGALRAQQRFDAMLGGHAAIAGNGEGDGDGDGTWSGGVVDEAGADDPGHVHTRSVPRLQRRLSALTDEQAAERLEAHATADGRDHDARRVRDLCDESVNHEWLYSLAPTSRHTMEPDSYVDAVLLRLGAARGPPEILCRVSGASAESTARTRSAVRRDPPPEGTTKRETAS